MSLLIPGIRSAAFRLPKAPFICRQCLRQKRQIAPARIHELVRLNATNSTSTSTSTGKGKAGFTLTASATASSQGPKRAFPETNPKSVAYWLIGSAASVFGIVVFGGLTRLTESG